jgi:hypothetical protein
MDAHFSKGSRLHFDQRRSKDRVTKEGTSGEKICSRAGLAFRQFLKPPLILKAKKGLVNKVDQGAEYMINPIAKKNINPYYRKSKNF